MAFIWAAEPTRETDKPTLMAGRIPYKSNDQIQKAESHLQEKFVLQEDLTVSDRDDVGWDVVGDITGLGLNDWEGGQGTGAEVVRDLGGTLQETGVEVENVTGVGLKSFVDCLKVQKML